VSDVIIEDLEARLFAFDVLSDGVTVLATTNSDGTLWQSPDEGRTWHRIWAHPDNANVTAGQLMYVDRRGSVFAKFTHATDQRMTEQLWRSTDGGRSFHVVLQRAVNQPIITEDSLGCLYAGTYGRWAEVWRSTNGGGNWEKVWDDSRDDDGQTVHMHGLIVDPTTDWVYAMEGEGRGRGSSVYRSKDRGASWTKILTLDGVVNPNWVPMGFITHRGHVYFGSDIPQPQTTDYIYRFRDNGLDLEQNIKAEQVLNVVCDIAYWMRVTPTDDYIVVMMGNKVVYSRTGDPHSWTIIEVEGNSYMFSHNWSASGWMFMGSGLTGMHPSRRIRFAEMKSG
jgi:photosystem II stability/assembly factor-like uncharacterized protein